jgi:peptidoglycan/LPS O-acetylase OafA/YrhL
MAQRKIDALTGVRFIAAAMILVHHASIFRVPVPPFALDHGVSLFFVLSGFILSYVYPQLGSWSAIRRFLGFRAARIWPAHATTAVIAAIVGVVSLGQPFDGLKFIANLLMVQAWIPMEPWYFSFNSLSWSISTEFFFYLAFPFLIWHWRGTCWWKWLTAAGCVAALVFVADRAHLIEYSTEDVVTLNGLLYINPLARILEFVTGMVAYSAFAWLRPRAAGMGRGAGTMMELIVVILTGYFIVDTPAIQLAIRQLGGGTYLHWVVHTGSIFVFPALLVVLALQQGVISRLLDSRIAVLLGEISYSVYLVHYILYSVYVRYWLLPGTAADYKGWALCVARNPDRRLCDLAVHRDTSAPRRKTTAQPAAGASSDRPRRTRKAPGGGSDGITSGIAFATASLVRGGLAVKTPRLAGSLSNRSDD